MATAAPTQELEQAVLSPEQREFFDANGYLVIQVPPSSCRVVTVCLAVPQLTPQQAIPEEPLA